MDRYLEAAQQELARIEGLTVREIHRELDNLKGLILDSDDRLWYAILSKELIRREAV